VFTNSSTALNTSSLVSRRRRRTEEEDDDDEEITNSRDFEEFLSFLQLHHNYHLQSTTPPRKLK
jgi:hypothetical protein